MADLFQASSLAADPLRILTTDGDLFNVLRLVGVIGTVLLIRRAWWAAPLTILFLGTQVASVVMALRYTATSHTFLLIYSRYLVNYLTLIGGILVMTYIVSAVLRRAPRAVEQGFAVRPALVALVAAFMSLLGYTAWSYWAPAPHGIADRFHRYQRCRVDVVLNVRPPGATPQWAARRIRGGQRQRGLSNGPDRRADP